MPAAPSVWIPFQSLKPKRKAACRSGTSASRCGGFMAAAAISRLTGSVLKVWPTRSCGIRPKTWFITGKKDAVAGKKNGCETVSQKSRKASSRFSGALPAISAVLNAPMEMPASQFGAMPASCRPW